MAAENVSTGVAIRVADEVWIGLALLHREQPDRVSFPVAEIRRRIEREQVHPDTRPGIATHISQHCVANVAPTSGTYRMLLRLPDGSYRLYRHGDECHPRRSGKMTPVRGELPEPYHYLLDWYDRDYRPSPGEGSIDPVLAMIGVGREIWHDEGADAFLTRLREGWGEENMSLTPPANTMKATPDTDAVWARIVAHEGELFRTTRRLPLTYQVEGNGIWFFREGKRIEMRLSRTQVNEAIGRCPLENTVAIKDLRDYAFLFAILMDERIKRNDW
jgi:hypothetical protein